VDSQAAQLAVAELQLAIRNAQVSFLFCFVLYMYTINKRSTYFVLY
jgi:hypothetical protein